MQLYFSQNSPFARVARIAAIECGLASRIEHVKVVNRSADNPLLAFSPVCRVPTLVDGTLVLGEARNICRYFDHLIGEPTFLGRSQTDWTHVSFESMALGFLDAAGVWVRENRRHDSEPSAFILGVEKERAARCLDYFEAQLRSGIRRTFVWDFGGIVIGCAIAILEHNDLLPDWQADRAELAAWHSEQSQRQSMLDTRPV